jgi:hypothetical protein
MRTILGDDATTSGIREGLLAQEVICWLFRPLNRGKHCTKEKLFRNFTFFEVFSSVR